MTLFHLIYCLVILKQLGSKNIQQRINICMLSRFFSSMIPSSYNIIIISFEIQSNTSDWINQIMFSTTIKWLDSFRILIQKINKCRNAKQIYMMRMAKEWFVVEKYDNFIWKLFEVENECDEVDKINSTCNFQEYLLRVCKILQARNCKSN